MLLQHIVNKRKSLRHFYFSFLLSLNSGVFFTPRARLGSGWPSFKRSTYGQRRPHWPVHREQRNEDRFSLRGPQRRGSPTLPCWNNHRSWRRTCQPRARRTSSADRGPGQTSSIACRGCQEDLGAKSRPWRSCVWLHGVFKSLQVVVFMALHFLPGSFL